MSDLVRELLAERFPPVDVAERERPPTQDEYERRQRVLVDAMSDYGWRGRAPRSAA